MVRTVGGWWLWVAANLVGIALFLHFASQTWIEPELADIPGASGGSFIVWGVTALPIFLLFMLSHFVLGFTAYRELAAERSWRGTVIVSCTLVCWIAIFLFDNAHHGV